MNRKLLFTKEAKLQLSHLQKDASNKAVYNQVCKTLGLLETNLKHPSLNTHEYHSVFGANGEKVWEAYAQNKTPGAYRIFFHYGPDIKEGSKNVPVLTILTIVHHP